MTEVEQAECVAAEGRKSVSEQIWTDMNGLEHLDILYEIETEMERLNIVRNFELSREGWHSFIMRRLGSMRVVDVLAIRERYTYQQQQRPRGGVNV